MQLWCNHIDTDGDTDTLLIYFSQGGTIKSGLDIPQFNTLSYGRWGEWCEQSLHGSWSREAQATINKHLDAQRGRSNARQEGYLCRDTGESTIAKSSNSTFVWTCRKLSSIAYFTFSFTLLPLCLFFNYKFHLTSSTSCLAHPHPHPPLPLHLPLHLPLSL